MKKVVQKGIYKLIQKPIDYCKEKGERKQTLYTPRGHEHYHKECYKLNGEEE